MRGEHIDLVGDDEVLILVDNVQWNVLSSMIKQDGIKRRWSIGNGQSKLKGEERCTTTSGSAAMAFGGGKVHSTLSPGFTAVAAFCCSCPFTNTHPSLMLDWSLARLACGIWLARNASNRSFP
jgi:hypothetical protein